MEADQLSAAIAQDQQALASVDLGSFLESTVRPMVLQGVRDNFTSSVTPDGQEWPARKDPGDGHPLLMDEGNLLQGATGGGAGHISRVSSSGISNTLEVGVDGDVSGAIYHTEGTANMPSREFMGASQEVEAEIEQLLADEVLQRVFG